MRHIIAALLPMIGSPLFAVEPQTHRNIPYADTKNEKQTLDVYAPAEGKDHPVVFWIHGGGWQSGDKAEVHKKPQAFVDKGYVFISVNYRLLPNATIKKWVEMWRRRFAGPTTMPRTTVVIPTRYSSRAILPEPNSLLLFVQMTDI